MSSSISKPIDARSEQSHARTAKAAPCTMRLITAAFKPQEKLMSVLPITDDIALQDSRQNGQQRSRFQSAIPSANRQDLVDSRTIWTNSIARVMPAALSDEEIQQLVAAAINQSGAKTAKDMGSIMAILKPPMQGRADMGEVSKLIKSQLSA